MGKKSYPGPFCWDNRKLQRRVLNVGEFSSICCTSMAHAGNTKIWAKIISAYAKKCSITGFSSLRGGGGAKNASIYALSGHERIEKPSDQ